jgi:hypothetical protein
VIYWLIVVLKEEESMEVPDEEKRNDQANGPPSPVVLDEDSVFDPTYAYEDKEDDEDEPFSSIEIVGSNTPTSGHSCSVHKCCGDQVKKGDLLRLQKTVVDTDDFGMEEAIACILVDGAMETCRVAFIPRVFRDLEIVQSNIGKHIRVMELYATSRNSHKRSKSLMNRGMAGCVFLAEIGQIE